jgi:NADH:ubiquinone oxidoreductase subunit D
MKPSLFLFSFAKQALRVGATLAVARDPVQWDDRKGRPYAGYTIVGDTVLFYFSASSLMFTNSIRT